VQQVERLRRRRPGRQRQRVRGHDRGQLGETVRSRAVRLGDDAEGGPGRVDDHDRAVRPLGQQREGFADGVGRPQGERRVDDEVAGLHPGDDVGDDIDGDVLRQDREPAAPGDGLGHAAAGDGGHVRRDDRDRGPAAVPRGQVDVKP
jgi:hypothetical protein